MKAVFLILLAWLFAAAIGAAGGWMYARHGIAFVYFLCVAIGGGLITYWSIRDEHPRISRADRR